MNYRVDLKLCCRPLIVLASFISLGVSLSSVQAQSISLVASASHVRVDQLVTISLVVDSPVKLVAGVAAVVELPDGIALKGTPSKDWYQDKWKDVSILPRFDETELQIAAALKGAVEPCSGPCTIATFHVKATRNGTFLIQFVDSKTEALTSEQRKIAFAESPGTTIVVGDKAENTAESLLNQIDSIDSSGDGFLNIGPNESDPDGVISQHHRIRVSETGLRQYSFLAVPDNSHLSPNKRSWGWPCLSLSNETPKIVKSYVGGPFPLSVLQPK